MMIGRSGSRIRLRASLVRRAGATLMPRSVFVSRSAIATTSIGRPTRRAISARCLRSTVTTPVPIVPKPISPTRTAAATARDSADADPRHAREHGASERAADAADRLAGAVLVLDQREADEAVAALAEADPRRHRDL